MTYICAALFNRVAGTRSTLRFIYHIIKGKEETPEVSSESTVLE